MEKVDGGFQLDEAVELVDGEVELPEDGWVECLVDLLGNE